MKTYKDLRAEQKRLEQTLVVQKTELKNDFTALKDSLKPMALFKDMIGIETGLVGPLAGAGINAGIDMVLKNNVLTKTGFVVRNAVPFLLKTVVNMFSRNKGKKDLALHS